MAVAVLHSAAGWLRHDPTTAARTAHDSVLLPGTGRVRFLVRDGGHVRSPERLSGRACAAVIIAAQQKELPREDLLRWAGGL
jgi:hypothetical protein